MTTPGRASTFPVHVLWLVAAAASLAAALAGLLGGHAVVAWTSGIAFVLQLLAAGANRRQPAR